MSRQSSPDLAAAAQPTSYYRDAHGLPIEKPGSHIKIVYRGADQQAAQAQNQQQGTSTPVPVATSSSTGRTKSRAYQSGIAAGAEDVKYAAKYRDLKQKVKEIEADNDRLVFKVLQAKRNIQRAKLERAILYERLGALPASPPQGGAALPPQHAAQQQVPPGGQVPRHADARPYEQSSRHQRVPGPPAPHHHHRQHHQQPIQPAPPSHVSPPQHHLQAHHPHHPPRDTAHPGQLPITHAQQVITIQTQDGPLLVVAGPDGRPVMTADGHYIPAQEIHHPPPPSTSSHQRKRGGRISKETREMREREAREMREREEMERKQAILASAGGSSGNGGPPHLEPNSRSHSGQGMSPPPAPGAAHGRPMSRERERDWEIEREIRERERMQRREDREDERERHGHGHHSHHHHHTHGHGHGRHHHQQAPPERVASPPPPPGPSPVQGSRPQPHRTHSQTSHASHASYLSHHSHGHHVHSHSHSHSHSGSPLSPGGSSYPGTRIHNHQRIGPGSYVLRDRGGDVPPVETSAPTPVPATPSQGDETPTNAPTPAAAPMSRVPTPPYIQRPGRTELLNNHASPAGEDATSGSRAKSEANPSEEGTGGSTTPS